MTETLPLSHLLSHSPSATHRCLSFHLQLLCQQTPVPTDTLSVAYLCPLLLCCLPGEFSVQSPFTSVPFL